MSWVIHRNVTPCSAWSAAASARISACTVTSSAVVGSSAMRSRERSASAIAIMTRWRMPPESSCGYMRATSAARWMPTWARMSTA